MQGGPPPSFFPKKYINVTEQVAMQAGIAWVTPFCKELWRETNNNDSVLPITIFVQKVVGRCGCGVGGAGGVGQRCSNKNSTFSFCSPGQVVCGT